MSVCPIERAAFDNCLISWQEKARTPIPTLQVPGTPYTSPPECSRLAEALYQCERREAAQQWGLRPYPSDACQAMWDATVECRLRLPANKQQECADLQAKYTSCESVRTTAPGLPGGEMKTGDVSLEDIAAVFAEKLLPKPRRPVIRVIHFPKFLPSKPALTRPAETFPVPETRTIAMPWWLAVALAVYLLARA